MADASPEELAEIGLAGITTDRPRLDKIHRYGVTGEHDGPYVPRSATDEYKLLATRSITNILPLLVKTPAQCLAVDGYVKDGQAPDERPPEWDAWQDNRMDARQSPVHSACLLYGQAFVTGLPDIKDSGRPRIRGVSPRLMYASYEDPAADALPLWVLQLEKQPEEGAATTGWLIDTTTVYTMSVGGKEGPKVISQRPHGVTLNGEPICPVVRFAPDIDLEGSVRGVVEPMIPVQDRFSQTVFDLLVAQTFSSFTVRTASGMEPKFRKDPETGELLLDSNGQPIPIPVALDASRMLMAKSPDTKFNTLAGTPLGGLLEAVDMAAKHMSVISQTPPHYLLGSLINIGAEALAAAESALQRAVSEYKNSLGESWELVNAISGSIMGQPYDPRAQVTWKDVESRSLSSTVDALGKAAQMLEIPKRALWSRIPGVSATDVEAWVQLSEMESPAMQLADRMASVALPSADPGVVDE